MLLLQGTGRVFNLIPVASSSSRATPFAIVEALDRPPSAPLAGSDVEHHGVGLQHDQLLVSL